MSQEYRYTLNGKLRQDKGKGASRRLRREGWVPAVVYGGEGESISIAIKQDELAKNAKFDSFYSQIINLKIEGKEDTEVLVRDVQRHVFKPLFQHFDFQRIVRGQDIYSTVSLHFINEDEAPGVKEENGVITHFYTSVEIVCQPRHLPEYIEVDMGSLSIGDSVYLSDLKLPEGVSLQQDENLDSTLVASIGHPRLEEEEEEESDAEAIEDLIEGDGDAEDGDAESSDDASDE